MALAAILLMVAGPAGLLGQEDKPSPPPPVEEEPAQAEETEAQPAEPQPPGPPKRLEIFVPDDKRPEVPVVFVSDGPCVLRVDGEILGELEPGEEVSFEVKTGQRLFKATSKDAPAAVWSKVVKVREERQLAVSVKMLKAIRDLRRRERQSGVLRDSKTLLMWARRDNGADLRWQAARDYCEDSELGGYGDWRLPTLDELKSVRAVWSQAAVKIIGGISLSGCCPWSSEVEGEARAWNYSFRHRRPFLASASYSSGLRALCVRRMDEDEELGRKAQAKSPAKGAARESADKRQGSGVENPGIPNPY